jgi:tetratricopeptide (TPR) repeat protein/predicted Ser/Thr protein kinase
MVDLEATLRSALDRRYSIAQELGRGGMSVVYLAHDRKHNRDVAIKVLRPELSAAVSAERFHREIEVVAGLTHPHILPLHDSGEADGLLYFVMPYIEGESLRTRLEREGRLPLSRAVRIAREIAGALGFAHRHGVVHRDVKPGNILLSDDHALLADFGVARLVESREGTLTGTGLALGTPVYFSPEQATGEQHIDGRSDIYSLGCVLFETLAGRPPFVAENARSLITQHLVEPAPRVSELRPEVPESLDRIVATALEKAPESRFASAEEMAASLDLVAGTLEAPPATPTRRLAAHARRRIRNPPLVLAALILVAAAAVLFAVRAGRSRGEFTSPIASYVLVPTTGPGTTARDSGIAARAVNWLEFHLKNWNSIRVMGPFELEGQIADLRLAGFAIPPINRSEARTIADRVGGTHIVVVRAVALGDSVRLQAAISPRDRPDEEETYLGSGRESDLEEITAAVALDILEIHGEDAGLEDLLYRSQNHFAHQQFFQGLDALHAWRLAEAERHFQEAVAADSQFALAWHYLAETLYWNAARNPSRMVDLGPEIEGFARRAARLGRAGGLRPVEERHVQAFNTLWAGDYPRARAIYDSLLAHDASDLEALLMRGSVEVEDEWIAPGPAGSRAPRADLSLARSMFDSATSIRPEWQLAWGRLYDIEALLARAAFGVGCPSYHRPEYTGTLTPYSTGDATAVTSFCPIVAEGKIAWVGSPLTPAQRALAREGVLGIHDQTVRRLERWARVDAVQARQWAELSAWVLWERSLPGCAADVRVADSLAALALTYFQRALEAQPDTSPEDRIRLAVMGMQDGDIEAARWKVDSALAELGDWRAIDGPTPPLVAANPYMASGAAVMVADLVRANSRENSISTTDPDDESRELDMSGTWNTILALQALGYMGAPDPGTRALFDELDRAWGSDEYSERDRAVLRWRTLQWLEPAVALRPSRGRAWLASIRGAALPLSPVWDALMAADGQGALARERLARARSELEAGVLAGEVRAEDFLIPILLAERAGADSAAADLKEQALACPLSLADFDPGWGLRHFLTEGPGI